MAWDFWKKYDFSFWDDVPDDINSAEDFEKNMEAMEKTKKLLDEYNRTNVND